jgi:tripartite-type tricarboxylate transporter receptor subunit TctC
MKPNLFGLRVFVCAVLAALAASGHAQQDYPNKSIHLIVPYAPGGSTTYTSRLVGQRLTETWRQQVIIDNRPGANTIIGTHLAVKSPADGYTLLLRKGSFPSTTTPNKPPRC